MCVCVCVCGCGGVCVCVEGICNTKPPSSQLGLPLFLLYHQVSIWANVYTLFSKHKREQFSSSCEPFRDLLKILFTVIRPSKVPCRSPFNKRKIIYQSNFYMFCIQTVFAEVLVNGHS